MTFLKGCVLGAGVAAVLVFAILPRVTTFPSLCLALGLALCLSDFCSPGRGPRSFIFAASVNFLPMLTITNGMTFDASEFWNSSSAILAGIACGAIAMLILPPLSPAIRTQRLLALTLADLRRLARRASPGKQDDWESRGVARLLAMPDKAEPVERAELAAAVAVGKEIVRLSPRRAALRPGRDRATRRFKRWPKDEAAKRSSASRTSTAWLAALPRTEVASRILLEPQGQHPGDFRPALRIRLLF